MSGKHVWAPKMVDGVHVPLTEEEIRINEMEAGIEPAAEGLDVPVPPRVTNHQLRLALLQIGLLNKVEEWVRTASRENQITWEYAPRFERHCPFIHEVEEAFDAAGEMDQAFRLGFGK